MLTFGLARARGVTAGGSRYLRSAPCTRALDQPPTLFMDRDLEHTPLRGTSRPLDTSGTGLREVSPIPYNERPMADKPAPASWKTTYLGYAKYALSALAAAAFLVGVDLAPDPVTGEIKFPGPGEAWYVYVLVIARWLVGIVQSVAMRDKLPTPPPGADMAHDSR